MVKNCTSIEQSKKLMELGIDITTADMCWCNENDVITIPYIDSAITYCPAWSLSALMNIIEIEKVKICFNCNNNKYWVDVHFESLGSFCQDHELYDSKIDALIVIIEKLKSRNLL